MPYQITDCRDLQASQLCSAMNAAFSDYVVPLSLTEDNFRDFQKQRGFSAEHSFVAMARDEIAAFWFSSPPLPSYENHAYTLSVGTVPAHRRKGLSRELLQRVIDRQKPDAGQGLQLEVITTNEKAVQAYQDFGFETCRTLRVCRTAGKRPGLAPEPDFILEEVPVDHLPGDESAFFDVQPTPQNSRAALRGLLETSHVLGVRVDGSLAGWGASYGDGSVAQVAVHKEFRRRGAGRALLDGLWAKSGADQLTFVNVDVAAEGVNAFLDRYGVEDRVQQLEMRLTFKD
ncbi:GNAT family N-acetyltransferase [Roseibium sp. MMSF_3412]|uniref:GNAT family N-acetyltransferase n=1 Tax=Roseibium sp. MMSF_3412 TaxID=3046712 RepID=UPI00273DFFA9|nr:GNAT family N-acetyltransferase [Roseibium sp. MMSF_3412]